MCKNKVDWLYQSEAAFSWESGFAVDADRVFYDERGAVRLIIEKTGRMTVTGGYAWNGCSPKVCIFDLLVGTPDGVVYAHTGRPKTYFASMIHDALYQFLQADSPISRRQADACFLRLMAESEFSLRWVYWAAVRLFGRAAWLATKAKRGWRGSSLDVADLGVGR